MEIWCSCDGNWWLSLPFDVGTRYTFGPYRSHAATETIATELQHRHPWEIGCAAYRPT